MLQNTLLSLALLTASTVSAGFANQLAFGAKPIAFGRIDPIISPGQVCKEERNNW